ncbi:hypothetical protein ACOMHN_058004 [Nucella lapillus]
MTGYITWLEGTAAIDICRRCFLLGGLPHVTNQAVPASPTAPCIKRASIQIGLPPDQLSPDMQSAVATVSRRRCIDDAHVLVAKHETEHCVQLLPTSRN